jgi:serine/threonine protein kinase
MTVPMLPASAVEPVGDALHDSDACTVHRACILPASTAPEGPVALKRIKISNAQAFDRFERERAVLIVAEHPCIVKPHFIIQDAPCYGLVLPLAERGSLSDMLHTATAALIPPALVVCFCRDLVSALEYVHVELKMLHRDVKPANAVISSSGRAVLIDFDRACPQSEVPGQHHRKGPSGGRQGWYMVGTLVYMAPELLERRPWSTGSDIYSLAITMNEIVTGCVPFSDVR